MSDNHYTIRANVPIQHHNIFKGGILKPNMLREVGFEPTRIMHQVLSLAP